MESSIDISDAAVVLRLAGSFDARSTGRVRAELYALLADHERVVVDLGGVETVDVTALRVLAAASRFAGRQGRHLSLRGCNGAVRRLLALSHLRRVVEVERAVLVGA